MGVAPHNGTQVQEKLDVILTTAAFDQPLTLLFLDDGVFQLKKGQQPETQGLKDTAAIFKALEIYKVSNLYVEYESLQERGLLAEDLTLSVQTIRRKNINHFMQQYDVVVSG